jgi:enterochelin esterase-like enzyme
VHPDTRRIRKIILLPLAAFLWVLMLNGCRSMNAPSGAASLSDPTVYPATPMGTRLPVNRITPSEKPGTAARFPDETITPQSATITPQPTPSPTALLCLEQGGQIEEGSLRTSYLPLPMDFRVYLPACYDQQSQNLYPVLYLIHGQNFNDDQWDRLGADETADRLIASGEIPPLIIVMPRDRSWSQPSEDNFGLVLAQELVPWIDENYRTKAERNQRAIGGLSRGASWAIHLGLSHWELFSSIGLHSPPVFQTDTGHVREWLDAIPRDSLPRIYMDIGERDRQVIMRSAVWFENLLTEKNIPHEWHLFPGYHEESYWEAHVETYLRWYSAGWAP